MLQNTVRKNFAPSEGVAIWEAIEKRKNQYGALPESGKASAKKILGIGYDSLSKAKQVVESGNKELIQKMDETGNVNRAYQEVKREHY